MSFHSAILRFALIQTSCDLDYNQDVPFLTPSDNPGHRPVAAQTMADIIQQHTYRLVAQNSTNIDLEYPSPSKVHMTRPFYNSALLHTGFIECIAPYSLVPQPVPGSDIIRCHVEKANDEYCDSLA